MVNLRQDSYRASNSRKLQRRKIRPSGLNIQSFQTLLHGPGTYQSCNGTNHSVGYETNKVMPQCVRIAIRPCAEFLKLPSKFSGENMALDAYARESLLDFDRLISITSQDTTVSYTFALPPAISLPVSIAATKTGRRRKSKTLRPN
jgi:hypothetical protein